MKNFIKKKGKDYTLKANLVREASSLARESTIELCKNLGRGGGPSRQQTVAPNGDVGCSRITSDGATLLLKGESCLDERILVKHRIGRL